MTIPDSKDMMENESIISLPCTPEEERRIVDELTKKSEANLKQGNLYYIISNRWFTKWQKYVGHIMFDEHSTDSQPLFLGKDSVRPGPIDNTDIVTTGDDSDDNDPQLSRTLEEQRDYVLVPEEVWEKLLEWYKGGPALPRKMISMGINETFGVEVYPLSLKLIDSRDKSQSIIRLSKKASLGELYERVSTLKGIAREKVRIWDYFNYRKETILVDSNQSLEDSNLQLDQPILLDVQEDGFWSAGVGMDSTGNELALVPMEPSRSSLTIAGGPSLSNGYSASHSSNLHQGSSLTSVFADMEDGYETLKTVSKGDKGGLAGLQNLGNTCFMNSALQCLVHTPPLMEYFLQDYRNEINKENPLGMRGELALAFGELLQKLWTSGRTPVAPRVFKGKLARFAPQFSGYNQHDSQELLAFLLDGLHEDLNRVKQKPYFETKDYDGRADEEVADENWRYHKARNDSIVVDVCQGQYKSTLVCPDCKKISITFDPFMYLSLPLPSTATRSMTVTIFDGEGSSLPMPFTVNVLQQGCCKDLFQALSLAYCLKNDEILIFAEVYDHRIYRYLDNAAESLQSIKDDDYIVAYRVSKQHLKAPRLEICHRNLERSMADNSRPGERKPFLTPLVTHLEGAENGADIHFAVDRVLSPLRRKTFVSSTRCNVPIENGSASEPTWESTSDTLTESGVTNQSKVESDTEEMPSREPSFQICLSDERGMRCKPIAKDWPIEPSRIVRIMLDWTGREHELYDTIYLKDLPVVLHKTGGFTVKKTKQEAISLFSCLDAFLKEEPLGPDDMWYCPGCKEHRQATKKLDLWRLPDILVFHLKRFSYSRYFKNKLDTFVNFPVHNLDLSNYVKCKDASAGSHVYELYAISNHYGGLGGGHYSAYAKLIDEDRWYHFDDSHVSPVSESDIRTSAAYVLFYQRVKADTNRSVGEPSQGY